MARTITTNLTLRSFFYINLITFLLLATRLPLVLALFEGQLLSHSHHEQHHSHHNSRKIDVSDAAIVVNARSILSEGMEALVVANKLRLQNPDKNRYKFRNSSEILSSMQAAPLLSYGKDRITGAINQTTNKTLSEDHDSPTSFDGTQSRRSYAYKIPAELSAAARVIAEWGPPARITSDHTLSSMLLSKGSDTNVMCQASTNHDGLHGWIPDVVPALCNTQNTTNGTKNKRASSNFWMRDIKQNGQSPFAPVGYKLWRNLMDYGAAGNGVTDDTHAINAAISDGGRCGVSCGSSTIYPATVYFPPGNYLVSSPVVQYYNTEILGDPTNLPTIVAASSFVGLGVITSDVYIGITEGWYLDTSNFLRSIRNFNMDITRTQLNAQVCGIHWQVAQGTSLENIHFIMSSEDGSTQQGIYMENGSGGWLSDLTFVGGMFGAYFGNQQFTSRNLIFDGCKTALQISWDWAWTMQGITIKYCEIGIVIVVEAGSSLGTSQGVGSLSLLDLTIEDTPIGIETSLFSMNSTALLIENAYFKNVLRIVTNKQNTNTLLDGSTGVATIDSWGFGQMTNSSGVRTLASAQSIPPMSLSASLVDRSDNQIMPRPKLFTRRRPTYNNIGFSQIIDVTIYGAVGDGKTDNTAALNSIFAVAANMSSIVFIPFGVYKIYDTVHLPVGSRIVGQAWSQIMATGDRFREINNPRVAIQVGKSGDVGVIEIQNMMFTVSGPTAGAILVEWNVHEIEQGAVGMWDTHIRVGGAIGSDLQLADCPKLPGEINPKCMAALLLFHMTPKSSGYLENSWMWVADHDMDIITQDPIDVYSGRGLLIESQGPTWLYGTSVEHNVLYQYQISGAKDVLMGVIQTESPYFQVGPAAPSPFSSSLGLFSNDPTFDDCETDSISCAVSWAVRIIESVNVWFQKHEQACLATESCQDRVFGVEHSSEIWVYNLVTKGSNEMISPVNGAATLSSPNQNGSIASLLAWLEGVNKTIGARNFPGFQLYNQDFISDLGLPKTCVTALTTNIHCDDLLANYTTPRWAGSLENDILTNSVCNAGCGSSLASYFNTVDFACEGHDITEAPPTILGGFVWQGYNETCLKDPATGRYFNDVILDFTLVADVSDMPRDEMCSVCYTQRLKMMRSSQYSGYDRVYSSIFTYVANACSLGYATDVLPPLVISTPPPTPICASENYYTTKTGDTCDTISLSQNISSASLFISSTEITNCANITPGVKLCLPLSCQYTYTLQPGDTCVLLEGLQQSSTVYGTTLCFSPQGGNYDTSNVTGGYSTNPFNNNPYSEFLHSPPKNSTVANGTTLDCGKWYTAAAGDDCPILSISFGITTKLLMQINPSLPTDNCSSGVMADITYCVSPTWDWNVVLDMEPDVVDSEASNAARTASLSTSLTPTSSESPDDAMTSDSNVLINPL
ncbi:hypothetical protein BHYA_0245g00070 [Botrytis hyacinthi]|uniref:LysM domain-containing protein n=1 Tax=Botrytis hyacinthi TaxID=278943 RepID=A0A4Z1G8Y9_9HELO|nr:hypothetical protein BHYA_0245g00070 [Botrytis hyacinthi]